MKEGPHSAVLQTPLPYPSVHLCVQVVVTRGAELHLRHFQSGLRPIYPPGHPLATEMAELAAADAQHGQN